MQWLSYMSEESKRERTGVFGGSFDPIHVGHLLLAELAREQLRLDRVLFIPAAISPLKLDNAPRADQRQRLEMLKLATGGNAAFSVDDRELRRGGTSFTVDTLRELASERPSDDLYFLMGADSLSDFAKWREPEEICRIAFVAVLARGGHARPEPQDLAPFLPADQQAAAHEHILSMPELEISSSDLRERCRNGQSVRYQLHPAVESYIRAEVLYRLPSQ